MMINRGLLTPGLIRLTSSLFYGRIGVRPNRYSMMNVVADQTTTASAEAMRLLTLTARPGGHWRLEATTRSPTDQATRNRRHRLVAYRRQLLLPRCEIRSKAGPNLTYRDRLGSEHYLATEARDIPPRAASHCRKPASWDSTAAVDRNHPAGSLQASTVAVETGHRARQRRLRSRRVSPAATSNQHPHANCPSWPTAWPRIEQDLVDQ